MSNDCSWAERYAFRHLHFGSNIPSSEYRFWPKGRRKPYFLTIRFLESKTAEHSECADLADWRIRRFGL
jgi:hypothetical protein